MHSMSFLRSMSILIVYGGKLETENSTKYLDDLKVLNLKTLAWMEVNL